MALKPLEVIIRAKDEASSIFGSVQSKVAALGAAVAAYFGINAFVGAVKGAADLEAALSQVQAVSGATAEDMVRLREAAEAAGANTKYTATEAATALGNLARAGLTAQQAIEALPATLQLAQAGGIDLGKASEYLTKAVTGMGGSFADAGRFADVLAQGANASNTSVTGLAEALSYAAPTAKALGLSLEDTVAIIGKFADSGIDASRAGTALNSILSQFSDPASTFKKALSEIGITTNDFNKALGQLADAGPKGQKAITAVGLEAGPALKALLGQGIGALDELRNKLLNAQGSAEATAATMGNNLNGAMLGLGSAWDTLKNALATPVLPVLKSGVDQLAAAFRDAVSSGVVAKFGAAIATGFESAITWAKAFAAEVDFAALATTLRGYATQAGEAFTEIKNAATTAGDVVRLVWGTMSAGANGVLTAVYGVGEVFTLMLAQIQTGISLALDGFAKITFGDVSARFATAASEMKLSADATTAAAVALENKAVAAFNAMADGAQTARTGWQGLTTDAQGTDAQMRTSAGVIAATATELQALADKTRIASNESKLAAVAQVEMANASKDAAKAVAGLRQEFLQAINTGNVELANQKFVELKAAIEASKGAVKDLGKAAAEQAAAVASAFSGMGIKTKAELTDAANIAKSRFELIKNSGQATADGLATAWQQMAQAAIAANGGVATETLKAQASMYKLQITTDATGKSIVSAMGSGTTATNQFAGAVADARTQMERLNAERERGIAAQEKANELAEREKALTDAHYNRDKEGFSLNTAGDRIQEMSYDKTGVLNLAKEMGVSEKGALSLANGFDQQTMGHNDIYESIKAKVLQETQERVKEQDFADMLKEVERTGKMPLSGQWDDARTQMLKDAAAKSPMAARTTTATATASTVAKTYNVQIGGRTVRTASDADAQALMAALKDAKLTA